MKTTRQNRNHRYYKKHRRRLLRSQKLWRLMHPRLYLKIARRNRKKRRERRRYEQKAYFQNIKREVFKHYCNGRIRCQCKRCPIRHIDLLTIDHIKARRKGRKRTGISLWLWLKRQAYPLGFQILCWACNSSKGRGEHCKRFGKKH